MKKKIIIFLLLLLCPMLVVRADTINKVDMKINILEDGTANIVEVWNVRASGGSEWYKQMYNLGDMELSNFKVLMDGKELTYKRYWNVNDSMSEKAGYYGINYVSEGLELCFGKSDYSTHNFKLSYTLSNFVFNTDDSQVVYFTLLPKNNINSFTVEVSSYYEFPDDLDVWGYGYKGYAYVENGKIKMSNEGSLNNEYVVLLAKFPVGTFSTDALVDGYEKFDDVYNRAEDGTFDYDYNIKKDFMYYVKYIINFICNTLLTILPIGLVVFVLISIYKSGYGYINNKKIDKKNTPMFRDIPCNKDIYYANALISLNTGLFKYKESNILGAILLKWVREDKIIFKKKDDKDTNIIDLTKNPTFEYDLEKLLFDIMYEASGDGILETKEFEKWCRRHYEKFLNVFNNITNDGVSKLKNEGHVYKRTNKAECKKKDVMDDKIYVDSSRLYGLKLYLTEFSRMDTKEVMEVKLWDEYLMFAYLFGIADKVAKQFKNLYPEVIEQMENANIDYNTLIFVNNLSSSSVYAASSARSAAENYSSGGGGFSSGGGGGGSFGGGGSMGGR